MTKRSFARAPGRRRAGPDAPRAVVREHRRRLTDSLTRAAQSFHSRNPDPVAMLRVYEYGYEVDECEPKYENDEGFALWFEATKAGGPEETTIRVWRSQTPMPGRLAVEVEGDREEPAAKLTLWTLRYHEREEKGERLGKVIKATWGPADDADEGE